MSLADDIDLVDLLVRDGVCLRRMGRTWRGACPLHSGSNKTTLVVFRTPTGAWRWRCWAGCNNGKSGDAINYIQLRYTCSFTEALDLLGIHHSTMHAAAEARVCRLPPPPNVELPAEAWRDAMTALVKDAEATLWRPGGRRALEYLLHRRGLSEETICEARLGYVPRTLAYRAETDTPAIPSGIVIPHWIENRLWRVTIRRPANTEPRYYTVARSANAPFSMDSPTPDKPVVLVEGAFDALAIWQEARNLVMPVAVGATGCRAIRWFAQLAVAPALFLAFDADQAGDQAAAFWQDLFPGALRWRPLLKDPGDMLPYSGLIRMWIETALVQATK